jgi:tRNA pseudouridine32 synthase/23S rRNA pseudouridine746 synthase
VNLESERLVLLRQRASMSRDYLERIQRTYVIPSAGGDRQPLMELYAPRMPPVGAGDCAAPKLFGYAFERRLTPVALAEFWWGQPTSDGRREQGAFYP